MAALVAGSASFDAHTECKAATHTSDGWMLVMDEGSERRGALCAYTLLVH